jgi:hypothetical protein
VELDPAHESEELHHTDDEILLHPLEDGDGDHIFLLVHVIELGGVHPTMVAVSLSITTSVCSSAPMVLLKASDIAPSRPGPLHSMGATQWRATEGTIPQLQWVASI